MENQYNVDGPLKLNIFLYSNKKLLILTVEGWKLLLRLLKIHICLFCAIFLNGEVLMISHHDFLYVILLY